MSENIIELTEQSFQKEVISSDIPVLVDFWASWCGPCKALAPILQEISTQSNGKFKIAKVNVDNCPGLATKSDVMNIPTVIFFKDGKEVDRLVGLASKAKILEMVRKIL